MSRLTAVASSLPLLSPFPLSLSVRSTDSLRQKNAKEKWRFSEDEQEQTQVTDTPENETGLQPCLQQAQHLTLNVH